MCCVLPTWLAPYRRWLGKEEEVEECEAEEMPL
jgi:hypothetical protein